MDTRKRGRAEFGLNGNVGFKKSKSELESLSSGIGSKSKPCTKFFSIAGCPFGESCHFLHFVPGGYNAVAPVMKHAPSVGPLSTQNGAASGSIKTKLCNKYSTAEGCKFGDKCNFAHGEWELGKPIEPRGSAPAPIHTQFHHRPEPAPTSSFGASATAKISVDASLAGAIIGKAGVNSKQICRQTGVKLAIRDHESDPNLRNIELEGTFEQINQASGMVRELISSVRAKAPGGPYNPGSNYKTKMCENFGKGACTFGDMCHFAHGAAELRKSGV